MKQKIVKQQRGAALAISLILLLVVTLMVISGGREVLLQEKLVEAQRDGHISLAMVESAIEEARKQVSGLRANSVNWSDSGAGGYYSQTSKLAIDPFAEDANGDWQGGKYFTFTKDFNGDGTDDEVLGFMELLGDYTDTGSAEGAMDISLRGYDRTEDNANFGSSVVKVTLRATGRSGKSARIISTIMTMQN